ncbi:hypothetical protein P7C70_g5094, partial [Phenoliferia sp. Uapishka_3]
MSTAAPFLPSFETQSTSAPSTSQASRLGAPISRHKRAANDQPESRAIRRPARRHSPNRNSSRNRSRSQSSSRSRSRSDTGDWSGSEGRSRGGNRGRDTKPGKVAGHKKGVTATKSTKKLQARGRSTSRESRDSRYSHRSSSYDSRDRYRSRSWSRSISRSRSRSRSRSPPGGHRQQSRRRNSRSPSAADPEAPRKREEDDHAPSTSGTAARDRNTNVDRRDGPPPTGRRLSNDNNRFAPQSSGNQYGNNSKGKDRARSPNRSFQVTRNRSPLVRTRALSPINEPAYRFRFILPFAELVTILIGAGGWRAKEIKFFAGLSRLTFYQSEEFEGPLGELIGSREAIQDGLKGIAYVLEEEMMSMSESQRERCGNVEQWTSFGEEFMEDLEITKNAFLSQIRAEKGDRKKGVDAGKKDQGWQSSWQQGSGPSGDQREFDRERPPPPQKDNLWRASAWGLPASGPQNPSDEHHASGSGLPPLGDLASRIDGRRSDKVQSRSDLRNRDSAPDYSINIPKVAERYLIGHKGNVIQSIEKACNTRCFVERRLAQPCVQIWGSREQVERVLIRIDAVVSQHCPTWRVGFERDRLGPGWESVPDRGAEASASQRPLVPTRPPTDPIQQRDSASTNSQNLPSPPTHDERMEGDGSSAVNGRASPSYPLFSPPHHSSTNYSSNTSADAAETASTASEIVRSEERAERRRRKTREMTAEEWSAAKMVRGLTILPQDQILEALNLFASIFGKRVVDIASPQNGRNAAARQPSISSSMDLDANSEAATGNIEVDVPMPLDSGSSSSRRHHVGPVLSRTGVVTALALPPVASISTLKRKQSAAELDDPPPATKSTSSTGIQVATPTANWPKKQPFEIRIPWKHRV